VAGAADSRWRKTPLARAEWASRGQGQKERSLRRANAS